MTVKLVLTALSFLLAFSAHAQSAKVIKVSGRRAIVQTAPGTELKVGQTLNAGGEEGHSVPANGTGGREFSVTGLFNFSSLNRTYSQSGKNSDTLALFQLSGQFGWNKGTMEYGPRAGVDNSNITGTTVQSLFLGGFFDYNFVPNIPGALFVYGAGGTLDIGTSTTGSSSGSQYNLFAGGSLKWFPFNNTAAVRADAGINYGSATFGSNTVTSQGVVIRAGFIVYM